MKSQDVIRAFSALAQESRLALFRLLVRRGPEGLTPSEMSRRLDIPAPTLSFHLKELQNAGLIGALRSGRSLSYSVRFDQVANLQSFITAECCSQADDACDAACKPTVAAVSAPRRRRA